MKLSNLLPLILLALTACQEIAETNPTLAPLVVSKFERKRELYEGASGLVHLQLVQSNDDQLALPNQINVTIEKPSSDNSNFSITAYPDVLIKFLFAENSDVVTFGCHPEDQTTLPLNLNADRVILCGKIKIPSGKFEMHASTLELRDAEIISESAVSQFDDLNSLPSIMIYTANFIVSGSNTFTLEGYSQGLEKESAPALFLYIGNTLGDGIVHIISRKQLKFL